jgi:hypothetical protein
MPKIGDRRVATNGWTYVQYSKGGGPIKSKPCQIGKEEETEKSLKAKGYDIIRRKS